MVWVYEDENSHVLEGLDMDLDARAQNPEAVELIVLLMFSLPSVGQGARHSSVKECARKMSRMTAGWARLNETSSDLMVRASSSPASSLSLFRPA